MRALLLDRLPNVATAAKERAERPLNGVKVNDAGLVQALLDHGSYDVYYYIRESAHNAKADAYRNADRLKALDLGSLESFRFQAPDELVLFTSSHHLAKYVPFRQFCGHMEWPICGLTHGLSTNTLIPSYSWNYFASIKSYDAIICTSVAGKHALSNIFDGLAHSRSITGVRGFFPPRMPWIPLGIEIEDGGQKWHTSPMRENQGFVILCIGRLTASHKADLRPLIAAFLCHNGLPSDSTLIIAGDDTQGHIAKNLEEFARAFGSTRTVVVMPDISGHVKAALLKTADVALCMSDTYQETFGVSVLDAMAAGLPVVAVDWDGYRDIVQHGSTGFLVRTSVCEDTGLLNAVSMLIDPAHALGQRVVIDLNGILHYLQILNEDRSLAKQMGGRGRDRVEALYSWRSVISRYEELWEKLLRKGKALRRTNVVESFGFMDYDKVFAGYSESTLSLDTAVRVKVDSKDCLALLDSGLLFSPSPIAGFSDTLDRRILEVCRTEQELTLGKLIDLIADPLAGRSMVITQICRLAKYGLLSILPGRKELNLREESTHEADTDCALRPVGV